MLNIIEAILLGVIQGATEYLPISSSGHLLLIPSLFNLDEPNLNAIAIAHQGTLLAVIVYFRRDLWQIISSVYKGVKTRQPLATTHSRLGWYIAAGSIPAILAGLLLEDILEKILTNPSVLILTQNFLSPIFSLKAFHSASKSTISWLGVKLCASGRNLPTATWSP